MIPLIGILLAAHAPEPAHEPPPPKLPDDADPACTGDGRCYMFRDGAGCAGGCRLTADARARAALVAEASPSPEVRARAAAYLREQAEAKERKAAERAEAEAAARLAATPAKTLRRRARLAARAKGGTP